VLFSGGEPLSRPDTLELMRYARSLGLPITLSTNGLLIDDRVASELADIGVRYVGISLDGLQKVHDRLRGQRGAFEGSVAALRRCRANGLKTGVRFTIHKLNAHHLDDVIDTCVTEGIDRLCVYHLAYSGRGGRMSQHDLSSQQTRAAVERLFERTQQLHKQGIPLEVLTVGNHADAAYAVLRTQEHDVEEAQRMFDRLARTGGNRSGQNICSIDSVGNVHIDQFSWHFSVGNIRHLTFNEIWGADPADKRLRVLRNRKSLLPERCQHCRFVEVCNGNSRTRAQAATGDWAGMDPSCYLTDAEVGMPAVA
jgi:radical SAM protein with 4Fe4S-binding SPASM domain